MSKKIDMRGKVKCGYCGKVTARRNDRGRRLMEKLPNGVECCPACYPTRVQERRAEEQVRDAERRARAERRAKRGLARVLMPYAVKRAA